MSANVLLFMPRFRRGVYRTESGNAAYVSGPNAKTAYDLDMGERIPIESVTHEWVRKAEDTDMRRPKGGLW